MPGAIYGSRAVCVIVVLLLCTATRALCDVHRDAGGCPVRFPSIRAGAAAAHGEVSRSASAAAGRVPRRACDWARTEMQSAAGACIAARIASLPGRGAARVRLRLLRGRLQGEVERRAQLRLEADAAQLASPQLACAALGSRLLRTLGRGRDGRRCIGAAYCCCGRWRGHLGRAGVGLRCGSDRSYRSVRLSRAAGRTRCGMAVQDAREELRQREQDDHDAQKACGRRSSS